MCILHEEGQNSMCFQHGFNIIIVETQQIFTVYLLQVYHTTIIWVLCLLHEEGQH
jgi:accessory gene regulator protein AgrB